MGRAEREQGAACWPPCLPRSQYAPSCPLSYPPPPPPRRHLSPACCSRPTPTTPTACGETRQHQRKEGGEARAPLFLCFCSRYAPACSLLLLPTTQLFAHRPPPPPTTHTQQTTAAAAAARSPTSASLARCSPARRTPRRATGAPSRASRPSCSRAARCGARATSTRSACCCGSSRTAGSGRLAT